MMDFTGGLAQALAVKDNRIFQLEQRRSTMFAEMEELRQEIEQLKRHIDVLKSQLENQNG